MSVNDTSSATSIAPAPQTGHQAPEVIRQPAQAAASPVASAPKQAPEASSSPVPVPAAIGFSLHFDPDTGRMLLEAREPGSGQVIYQMPSKYAIEHASANFSAAAPTRGAKVDGAA